MSKLYAIRITFIVHIFGLPFYIWALYSVCSNWRKRTSGKLGKFFFIRKCINQNISWLQSRQIELKTVKRKVARKHTYTHTQRDRGIEQMGHIILKVWFPTCKIFHSFCQCGTVCTHNSINCLHSNCYLCVRWFPLFCFGIFNKFCVLTGKWSMSKLQIFIPFEFVQWSFIG